MGVSIDMHVYDYFDLTRDIKNKATNIPEGRSVEEFIDKVLPNFGIRAGDKFITLWNGYYEDYNSGSEMMRAFDLYFGLEGTFFGNYEYEGHANAHDVLYDLGIEPIDVEDED